MLVSAPLAVIGFALFLECAALHLLVKLSDDLHRGPSPNSKYAGAFLVAMGSFTFGSLLFAYTAANLSPDAARASGIAAAATLQNIGGLISPWMCVFRRASGHD